MPRRRFLPAAAGLAAAVFLAACAGGGAGGGGDPAPFRATAPVAGQGALLGPSRRSDALRGFNAGRGGTFVGERVCPRERDLVPLEPLVAPSLAAMRDGDTETKAARDFARALNASAARLLISRDPAAARAGLDALRAHAAANAWQPADRSWGASAVAIEAMGPLLPAWQILRQTAAATDADRAAIDAWILRVADLAEIRPGENNSGTFRGANNMLLGLMTGDRARYERGKREGFVFQLAHMREDGSFPLESDRGLTALANNSRNVGLLVYSAEIARSAGENLYTLEVGGRGLSDAIAFVVRGYDDNALVDAYASANRNPSKSHPDFRPGAQVSPWDSTGRAWARVWIDRFPRDGLSAELRQRADPSPRAQADALGGNITCFVSPL